MAVQVDHKKCDGCKSCEEVCPTNAIAVTDAKANSNADDCIDCNACIDTCPSQAIVAA